MRTVLVNGRECTAVVLERSIEVSKLGKIDGKEVTVFTDIETGALTIVEISYRNEEERQ